MIIRFRALGMLLLALTTSRVSAQNQSVAFDWFEYSGTDALETKVGPGEYQNLILAGFYPDPSICRVGDDYYPINSAFAYFPGIPIFHSRDLVNWEQVGHVIHRPDQSRYDRLGVSDAIYAPAITHHPGTFYVVCTQVRGNGNFVVTATNAATALEAPRAPGVAAGLAVFQSKRFNYFAGVRRETNGICLFLEQLRSRGGQGPELVKTVNLGDAKNVKLRITANNAKCNFEFAAGGGTWALLAADQDATLLTTEVAGGFVGATVGPYARTETLRTSN